MPRKSCSGARVTVLALSTSSPALSIALVDGRKVLARHHQLIGRGHAEALVPAIAALLTGRRVEAIIVDIGPGSYTGIRIGIAAARALGVAWGVPVHGVSALGLVAAQAFAADPTLDSVFALIDAGRGHAAGALIGPELVAPLPVELGGHMDAVLAVSSRSTNPKLAMDFIKFLTGPEGRAAWKAKGMRPF